MSGPFVSRGGQKLQHALDAFGVDPAGLICADLGCSTGGFTDCLLRRGAARVHAVDTAYGELAWALRNDPRVVVHERSNALHTPPAEPVDLVVIDLGWTPQARAVPAGLAWLRPGGGRVISLVKPHYELEPDEKRLLAGGVLPDDQARRVAQRTIDALGALGVRVAGQTLSPIRGGKSERTGNLEWLVLLEPARA